MMIRPPSYSVDWYQDDEIIIERDYDDDYRYYSTNEICASPSWKIHHVPSRNVDEIKKAATKVSKQINDLQDKVKAKKEETPLDWLHKKVEETCALARIA